MPCAGSTLGSTFGASARRRTIAWALAVTRVATGGATYPPRPIVDRQAEDGGFVNGSCFAPNNVAIGALNDRVQLSLLRQGDLELVEGLLEIVEECPPLLRGNVEVAMGVDHGPAGIQLRATRGPADHFGDKVLETSRWHFVVRLVDGGVRVQARVDHYAIDKVVDDRRDAIDTAEALAECGGGCWG